MGDNAVINDFELTKELQNAFIKKKYKLLSY